MLFVSMLLAAIVWLGFFRAGAFENPPELLAVAALATGASPRDPAQPKKDASLSSAWSGHAVPATANRTARDLLTRSIDQRSRLLDTSEKPHDVSKLPSSATTRYSGATNMLNARSPEEARWLSSRGYPSEMEYGLVRSGHGDVQALAERAALGDLTALGLLGTAQAQRGEFELAYANLEEAAARGSVFALIELGIDYSESPSPERMTQSMALHNLAVMRGDYRAMEFGFRAWRTFTQPMAFRAQVLAMRYWQNLNAYRASLGLPPFDNALRPGFGIEDAPSTEQIPIYPHRDG